MDFSRYYKGKQLIKLSPSWTGCKLAVSIGFEAGVVYNNYSFDIKMDFP
jgi:hypothetical protein